MLEEVHHGKYLSVVWYEALCKDVRGLNQCLQVSEGLNNNI